MNKNQTAAPRAKKAAIKKSGHGLQLHRLAYASVVGFMLSSAVSVPLHAQVVLYGMTELGGTHGKGNVFRYDVTTNTFADVADCTGFSGPKLGYQPNGNLMQASDGNLYGMSDSGGVNGLGNIFKYDPATSVYTDLVDFTGTTGAFIGENPFGSLVEAHDGCLYGMTASGGVIGLGNIFKYNPVTGVFTDVVDFTGNAGAFSGWGPQGSLTLGSDSCLYGMTIEGGLTYSPGFGNIFKYDPRTNVFTDLLDFSGTFSGTTNGATPYGSLIQGYDGAFYGMTEGGGIGIGNLFRYDPRTNTYDQLLEFSGTGPFDGEMPFGDVIQATDSNLYGMTLLGGAGYGNLFKLDLASGAYIDLVDFTGTAGPYTGYAPYGSLIEASDSNLYGMTGDGGVAGKGNIFRYNFRTNTYTDLVDFTGDTGAYKGSTPKGDLFEYRDRSALHVSVAQVVDEVKLYPNPAIDVVNVEMKGFNGNVTLALYDISGRQLAMHSGNQADVYRLDVSVYGPGVYILKIQDENGQQTMKEITVCRR